MNEEIDSICKKILTSVSEEEYEKWQAYVLEQNSPTENQSSSANFDDAHPPEPPDIPEPDADSLYELFGTQGEPSGSQFQQNSIEVSSRGSTSVAAEKNDMVKSENADSEDFETKVFLPKSKKSDSTVSAPKENLIIKIARKHYEKKIRKSNTSVTAVEKQITLNRIGKRTDGKQSACYA